MTSVRKLDEMCSWARPLPVEGEHSFCHRTCPSQCGPLDSSLRVADYTASKLVAWILPLSLCCGLCVHVGDHWSSMSRTYALGESNLNVMLCPPSFQVLRLHDLDFSFARASLPL